MRLFVGRAVAREKEARYSMLERLADYDDSLLEELVGDKPFDNLDDYITQDELRALSDSYKNVAGFALNK